ncbi:MAG TPA: hypothetical protein VJZ76_02830 [Thermoanaerobaculia bacterium]|nr:hypothetical protein [Thermoanaerobaculia bacterium]
MDAELKQYLDEFSERTDSQFRQVQEQFQHLREENTAAHEETRRVLRGEMAEMAGTLRGEMGEMAGTLRGEMGEIATGLRGEIAEAVSTLRGEMAAEHAETRRHFDITVERWETRFDLLAESVQMVDQKLDRNVADIREEIAAIKFTRPSRTRRAKR